MENNSSEEDLDEQIKIKQKELNRLKLKRKKRNKNRSVAAAQKSEEPTNAVQIDQKEVLPCQPPETAPITLRTTNPSDDGVDPRFATFDKDFGVVDEGKEFEKVVCGVYALKLSTDDDVLDFKMTSNKKECCGFDDIEIEVTFTDTTIKYLFQLKHKVNEKEITEEDLQNPKKRKKAAFDLKKYFDCVSKSSLSDDNSICILYTNLPIKISSTDFFQGVTIEEAKLEHEDLLLNCDERSSTSVLKLSSNNAMFYFFTQQDNKQKTKTTLTKMLKTLFHKDVGDALIKYLREWWTHNFVLTKHDFIVKLSELVLSPYLKTLSDQKINKKTELLRQSIMRSELTILERDDKIVENIWNTSVTEEFGACIKKFELNDEGDLQTSKTLWYLEQAPLIITTQETNLDIVKSVLSFLKRDLKKKKIVLVGKLGFENWKIFRNLADLKKESAELFKSVFTNLKISLQERGALTLKQLGFGAIIKYITTADLLEMSQCDLVIGKKEEVPSLHIPRTISTIFLRGQQLWEFYHSEDKIVFLISCQEDQKHALLALKNVNTEELSLYLEETQAIPQKVVLVTSNSKKIHIHFKKICDKVKKCNVYALHALSEDLFAVMFKKGSLVPSRFIDTTTVFSEEEIHQRFDYPLKVLCAPPGMGKSQLLKVLNNNSPSGTWAVYINLVNENVFLGEQPNHKQILHHFFDLKEDDKETLEYQAKRSLLHQRKAEVFLDGVDEVDTNNFKALIKAIRFMLFKGLNLWVSSRENLRHKIRDTFNTQPFEIQDLQRNQQKEFIQKKMSKKYTADDISKIVKAVFNSVDITKSQQVLGIPLQLHIITEVFVYNKNMYQRLDQKNVFALTQLFKMFFDGKKKFALKKAKINHQQEHQLKNIFESALLEYEVPALKICLTFEDFKKLGLEENRMSAFLKNVNRNGDLFGIIKKVENDVAVFDHQTSAEYFAALWLKKNKEKVVLLKDTFFCEKYENLRRVFDIMMAENNPLHLAVVYGNLKEVEEHLNGNCNDEDEGGRSALHLLCSYGVKYCLQKDGYYCALRESSSYLKMFDALITKCRNVKQRDNVFNFDCVEYTLWSNCIFPIEKFLSEGLLTFDDIKERLFVRFDFKKLALFTSQFGYFHILSGCIKEDPEIVNRRVFTELLLHYAVEGCETDVCSYTNGRAGNITTVELLSQTVRDINQTDDENCTALDIACVYGRHDVIPALVTRGAKCSRGNTMLHWIARWFKIDDDVKKIICDYNINVNARNDKGRTALHYACQDGSVENVRTLVDLGSDVNAVDEKNQNSLHHAMKGEEDYKEVVRVLLEEGVDMKVKNQEGKTALDLAEEMEFEDSVRMLKEVNGNVRG